MSTRRKGSRGIALVTVAIFMLVILGFTVLGIDVARLASTATEVQSVADAAARGGAKALLDDGGTPGTGITRAKTIANDNLMNGTLAVKADVLVDEGHWVVDQDTGTQSFACCTANTPCCANGKWGDTTCTGSAGLGCARVTAVLATPHTDVDNLLAGIFNFVTPVTGGVAIAGTKTTTGNEKTRVEKLAIAAPSGPANGCQVPAGCAESDWACYCSKGVAPCIPITVASCEFNPPNCNGVGCTLPSLQVSSDKIDTAAWTGYEAGHSDPIILGFMNQGPCGKKNSKNNTPVQNVGDTLDMTNGIKSGAKNQEFGTLSCLAGKNASPENVPQGCSLDANGNLTGSPRGTIFQIPVFEAEGSACDPKFTYHSAPVVGFATVRIDSVDLGSAPSVHLTVVANKSATQAQNGGGCFGTDCRVTMNQ